MYILQLELFTILYLTCAGNSNTKMELGGQPKPGTAKKMGDKKVTSANVVITSTQQDVIALNGQHTLPHCLLLKAVSQRVLGPCLSVQIQV